MASLRAVVRRLLAGEPAIRRQVFRDLCGEPGAVVAAERARFAAEGWGAQLLRLQSARGPLGRRARSRLDEHPLHARAAEGAWAWMRRRNPPCGVPSWRDFLRSAGVEPDERVAEAVGVVCQRRHKNGRWPLAA